MLSKEERIKANLIASLIKEYELSRSRIRQVNDYKTYQQLHEEILVKVYDKYASQFKQQPIPTIDEDELWNEILNALGLGFVNREEFISQAKQQFSITRK